ncbi:DUF1513 domain-containing protein [soil metagenome]
MAIDRRSLLAGLAAAVATRVLPARADAQALYISCRMDAAGQASAAMFSLAGEELFSTVLPARGHDCTLRPGSRDVVVFARRPGNWFIAADPFSRAVKQTVLSAPERHFYGHGAFSPDGRILYATENDTSTGNGVIGLYAADDFYRRIGEFSSRGIGPHDLGFLPDGRTLVIANGGLRTLPDSGREVLNRGDMQPNVALIDAGHDETRAVLQLPAELRALSIRHMAIAADRTVVFGCQNEGDPAGMPYLVGTVAADGKIGLFDMPELELTAMQNYVGSVALDADEEVIAATSPRGGSVALWNRRSGAFLGRRAMSDVCGVAALDHPGDFLLTSGNSGVRRMAHDQGDLARTCQGKIQDWVWDNHLIPVAS